MIEEAVRGRAAWETAGAQATLLRTEQSGEKKWQKKRLGKVHP